MTRSLDIAVVGSGPTGLTAALLLARDGHRVQVCETDRAPAPRDGADGWERRGVSQFAMPHVLLPRWHQALADALPDLSGALSDAGAEPLNLLHQQPVEITGGWSEGDERFQTLALRRSLLEATLHRLAAAEPNLELRGGEQATGLLLSPGNRPAAGGLRTAAGSLNADLVIDAAGRRSPVPGWVHRSTGGSPGQRRYDNRLTFFCRDFESADAPPPLGPLLTHHRSWSMLRLPADHGGYAIVLAAVADDRRTAGLRTTQGWRAAVRCSSAGAAWLEHGRATSEVRVHGSGVDVVRADRADDRSQLDALVALGDARAVTNPLLGRGLAIGALSALTLRDLLREGVRRRRDLASHYAAEYATAVSPWVDATIWFAGHRAAELRAEAAGLPYRTDDRGWPMTLALRAGAQHDAVLARASARIAALLASPAEVFADPEVRARTGRYLGTDPDGPTRADPAAAGTAAPPTFPTLGKDPSTKGVHHVRIHH